MDSEKREILFLDYHKTLEVIHKQVDVLFKIKEWAVVSCSAVIAYGVSQKSYWILLANLPLILGFYFIELFFREFHDGCLSRAEENEGMIQTIFNSEAIHPGIYTFGISHTFRAVGRKRTTRSFLSARNLRPSTWILYLLILLMTSAGAILIRLIK